MRHTPNNLGGSKFPPNPAQWTPERNGHNLRARFNRPLHHPLDPFDIARRHDGVELLDRQKFDQIIGPICSGKLFGQHRRKWSGFVLPVDGIHLIVINDTHSKTRQNATLTEELFHIALRHTPTKLTRCPITGLLNREYSPTVENEAFCSAAAALIPYFTLKQLLHSGGTIEAIAESFGVSVELVQMRMKRTKLWNRRN
jgi:Zn-dependent peptidase ImmA (M78 family)